MYLARSRRFLKKFPRVRETLVPLYLAANKYLFRLRNGLTRSRPVTVATTVGPVWLSPEGHIAQELWEADFEKEEREAVESLVRPGMRVLNIGANVGLYVVICGKLVGEYGEVHAFEPASLNYQRLLKNVALNGLKNVRSNQCAVSDCVGEMQIRRDPSHPNLDSHYSVHAVRELDANFIETISATTLDEYWKQNGNGQPVDLIIIDVEGGELSVFTGALNALRASPHVVIMAECTRNLDEIATVLQAEGFGFFQWNATAKKLVPTALTRGNIFIHRLP